MCKILNIYYDFRTFDMSRITHFLAEIMNPKNSASGKFLTFSISKLGQAHLKLELGVTLNKVCCITLMFTNYHYISCAQ